MLKPYLYFILTSLLFFTIGCKSNETSFRKEKIDHRYTIAIFPIITFSEDDEYNALSMYNVLADAIEKTNAFKYIHRELIYLDWNSTKLEDIERLLENSNVDFVIFTAVMDYDPYFPPKMSTSNFIYKLKSSDKKCKLPPINEILLSPVPVACKDENKENYYLIKFQKTIDLSDKSHKELLRQYVQKVANTSETDLNEDSFVRLQSNFWHFYFYYLSQEIVSRITHYPSSLLK